MGRCSEQHGSSANLLVPARGAEETCVCAIPVLLDLQELVAQTHPTAKDLLNLTEVGEVGGIRIESEYELDERVSENTLHIPIPITILIFNSYYSTHTLSGRLCSPLLKLPSAPPETLGRSASLSALRLFSAAS
ncbi:hypothetical protein EON64_06195 [archaeon]|nr:MAG: hypothetical protein EON64_06195 [archaeon]